MRFPPCCPRLKMKANLPDFRPVRVMLMRTNNTFIVRAQFPPTKLGYQGQAGTSGLQAQRELLDRKVQMS